MRIFDLERRINITRENEKDIFLEEAKYYTQNNVYPVTLFGKEVLNIYKNINVQTVLTYACNYKCGFCIERGNKDGNRVSDEEYASRLEEILKQYKSQGINPHVSITGGEPLLMKDRLELVLKVLKKYDIEKYNINTNGFFLRKYLSMLEKYDMPHINVSRHDYRKIKIPGLFGIVGFENVIDDDDLSYVQSRLGNITIQSVMIKGGVESVKDIKEFMNHYNKLGFKSYSFRGLSILDHNNDYSGAEEFTRKNFVDFFEIVNSVAKDPEFEFKQQKIGDHYVYEIWKYKGATLRFTYGNFSLLREIEENERKEGKRFSRATILFPDNRVTTGWIEDLNKLVG